MRAPSRSSRERNCSFAGQSTLRNDRPPDVVIPVAASCARFVPCGFEVEVGLRGITVPAAAAGDPGENAADAGVRFFAGSVVAVAVIAVGGLGADRVGEEGELGDSR
jgi:hypothetical protein